MSIFVNGVGGLRWIRSKHCSRQRVPWGRGATHLEALFILLLLLVNNAQSEKDFVRLVKVLVHAQHAGKGLFGVLERPISVVENADAVPELWVLQLVHVSMQSRGLKSTTFGLGR